MRSFTLLLLIIVVGCSNSEQTGLNSPGRTIVWNNPRYGATYLFDHDEFDTLQIRPDSSAVIETFWQYSLVDVGQRAQPRHTQVGRDTVVPGLIAVALEQQSESSTATIAIAVDSSGDFWLDDESDRWTHYPGIDPVNGIVRPAMISHTVDSSTTPGQADRVTTVRRSLGWQSLTAAHQTFNTVLVQDSSYTLVLARDPINFLQQDTLVAITVVSRWFVPSIGCYARVESHTTQRDPEGKTLGVYWKDELVGYTP